MEIVVKLEFGIYGLVVFWINGDLYVIFVYDFFVGILFGGVLVIVGFVGVGAYLYVVVL